MCTDRQLCVINHKMQPCQLQWFKPEFFPIYVTVLKTESETSILCPNEANHHGTGQTHNNI